MRRRIRQYIHRQWKRKYTRVHNLKVMCPKYLILVDEAIPVDWVKRCWLLVRSDGYWGPSMAKVMNETISNKWLSEHGMHFLMDDWEAVKERWTNRRMPPGTYGGVRGQPMD